MLLRAVFWAGPSPDAMETARRVPSLVVARARWRAGQLTGRMIVAVGVNLAFCPFPAALAR